jgi:Domain of unknown function (DUF4349)
MPATDTIDFEREFEQLVQELRALPTAAPDPLRTRVRELGEPERKPSLSDRLLTFPWRRSLLVLAPACVLVLVAAAIVHGVLNSSPERTAIAPEAGDAFTSKTSPQADELRRATLPSATSAVPVPNPNRYQDYEASMTVRVEDLDALSDQANEAMRLARSYGGYVVSLQQSSTAGRPGQADLVLRIPVARVEDALIRLADLGTVIERNVSIRDLERVVQQQRARIMQLKLFIARAEERLKGSLPADVRIRLELQLEEARRELSRVTNANKGTLREASLSRISLTLTTQKAVGAGDKGGSGRTERAVREAASFLAAAGAVTLFLLIVLSPLIVLAVAAFFGARAYRRREERRLLSAT